MSPAELHQLMKRSPALQEALKAEKQRLYQFMRQHIQMPVNQEEAWIINVCRNCLRKNEDAPEVYPLLSHPFDYPDYGWCIECIVEAFNADTPFWTKPEPEGWEVPEGVWWS